MGRVCQLSGKRTRTGYSVSHSNRRTKRNWKVNLRKVKIGNKVIKISAKYLKKFGLMLKASGQVK